MPNHNCCVALCKSRNKRDNVKFIKFPTDVELSNKWLLVIGREIGFKVTKNTRICSLHFVSGKRSYDSNSVDYIPSIFPLTTISQVQLLPFCKQNDLDMTQMTNLPVSFLNKFKFITQETSLPSTSQFGDLNVNKRRRVCYSQNTADIQCEPDIYPIEDHLIRHLPNIPLKSVDRACQTDFACDEIEELYSTREKLLNDIKQLEKQISRLKVRDNCLPNFISTEGYSIPIENSNDTNNSLRIKHEVEEIQDGEEMSNGGPVPISNDYFNFDESEDLNNDQDLNLTANNKTGQLKKLNFFTEAPKLNLNTIFSEVIKAYDAICKKWTIINEDNSLQAIQLSEGAEPIVQRALVWDEYGNLKISVHNRDLPSGHFIWDRVDQFVQGLNIFDIVSRILETVFLVAQYRVCTGNFELCYQNLVQSGFDRDNNRRIVGYKEMDFKEKIALNNAEFNSTIRSMTCHLLIDRQIIKCRPCQMYGELLNDRLETD